MDTSDLQDSVGSHHCNFLPLFRPWYLPTAIYTTYLRTLPNKLTSHVDQIN